MRKLTGVIFSKPLLVASLTSALIGIGAYTRALHMYLGDSVWGRLAFCGPFLLMLGAFLHQLRLRNKNAAIQIALLTLPIWMFGSTFARFSADVYVHKSTWHTARAILPDGLGDVEVRTRHLVPSWLITPPGWDSTWNVTVRTTGRTKTFQLHDLTSRPRADLFLAESSNEQSPMLILACQATDVFVLDLTDLEPREDIEDLNDIDRQLAKIGRFDWDEDWRFSFIDSEGDL